MAKLSKDQIKPLGNNIIVKIQEQNKTDNGLFLPSNITAFQAYATVIATGQGILHDGKYIPQAVKVGDTILMTPTLTRQITFEGEKLEVMDAKDILFVLNETK